MTHLVTFGASSTKIDGESDDERIAELNTMIEMIHTQGLEIGIHVTGDRYSDRSLVRRPVKLNENRSTLLCHPC